MNLPFATADLIGSTIHYNHEDHLILAVEESPAKSWQEGKGFRLQVRAVKGPEEKTIAIHVPLTDIKEGKFIPTHTEHVKYMQDCILLVKNLPEQHIWGVVTQK